MKVRVTGGARGKEAKDLVKALEAVLDAADPVKMVRRRLIRRGNVLEAGRTELDLSEFHRVFVLGAGKASARMALGVERVMGDRITAGCVIAPIYQPKPPCRKILVIGAPHPLPGPESVEGTKRLIGTFGQPREDDLAICLFSGGGSALMEIPTTGVELPDLERVTKLLMKAGSSIDELNVVRKHLSQVKGGRLAQMLHPARIVTLLISDVVGNRQESIASGPTVPDPSTYHQAKQILVRRGVWRSAPATVKKAIEEGVAGGRAETPKPGSECFRRADTVLVGDNVESCKAAETALREMGYRARLVTTNMTGEAREVGASFARRLVNTLASGSTPSAFVSGGETTVTVVGKGKGGRNQELALAASLVLRGVKGVCLASMGTDGVDGMTDAAGAVVGGETVIEAEREGLNPRLFLNDNDSNGFFRAVGGLISTGPTGTNVNDVLIGLCRPLSRQRRTSFKQP
jgi:glycerate 2-kinase